MRSRPAGLVGAVLGACMAAASAADAPAASSTAQSALKPLDTAQFQPDDDVKCLSDVLEAGDPARGPSTILLKATPGCVVPHQFVCTGKRECLLTVMFDGVYDIVWVPSH